MGQILEREDIQQVNSPEAIACLFRKLGYNANCQPLEPEYLQLSEKSLSIINKVYLIANEEEGDLQVLLFQLSVPFWTSDAEISNRMKLITNHLCKRPSSFLLLVTLDYRRLLLISYRKTLDEEMELKRDTAERWINLCDPSFSHLHLLESIAAFNLTSQEAHNQQYQVLDQGTEEKESVTSNDAVRWYLKNIGKVRLLTPSEEIVLGSQVQKMMKLIKQKEELEEELGRKITEEEWMEKAGVSQARLQKVKKVIQEGNRAKQRMIETNLRLVVAIAKNYQHRNVEFLDLIQEGTLGLERSVEKFDPTRGYKFSTYAYWWIRQAITRAIAQQARAIRLPIHITEKLNKIKKVQRELAQKLGRNATPTEIATELELEPSQIREYLSIARQPISLDVWVGDNQDTELSEFLEDEENCPETYLTQESMRQEIDSMLCELTPQQREVISLRFGLENANELSLAKVGKKLNLSRERVRQLEHQAFAKLRRRRPGVQEYIAVS